MFFSFLIFTLVVNGAYSGFQKNLDINIPFPPILDYRENIPTGHLRPLGWQNRADAQVSEESVNIKPEEFWDMYVKQKKPIIIRGLVSGSDVIEKWTDTYLNRNYGKLDIKVTHKKQTKEENKVKMSLNKFLQGYRVEDWNLNVIIPDEMLPEIPLPHVINCGPFIRDISEKNNKEVKLGNNSIDDSSSKISQLIEPILLISAGETSSLLQSQPYHNIHCVFDGRADFFMIPTEQFEKLRNAKNWRNLLDLHETFPHSSYWYSKINVDMVNAYKYKILQNLVWNWASLRAGDCIYLPANELHQVRSYGRGVATSIHFTTLHTKENKKLDQIKREAFDLCLLNAPIFEPMKLFTSEFLWAYKLGERRLNVNFFSNGYNTRLILLYLIRDEDNLYYEVFKEFYNEITNIIKSQTENLKPVHNKATINFKSEELWNDFSLSANNMERENFALSANRIFDLDDIQNLKRFKEFLDIASQRFETTLKIEKSEL
jgi:hypothetical protein